MTKHKWLLSLGILVFMFAFLANDLTASAVGRLQQSNGEKVIVVIDPGHGGDNNGTTENGFLEKEMTMTTSKALYEELTQFEGIEVYLTHWDDQDLSLKDRAKFAAEKRADFLISIHYNASESHELFGAETWISLFPEFHNYGYQLGTAFLREFRGLGLHLRGIKTRPHSNGKDYYGIIREAAELSVPAIIVEHCHVDHPQDSGFCDSTEELVAFGKADAHAIAKYFGLKSGSLGLDYSGEPEFLPEVTPGATVGRAMYDETPPVDCRIELLETESEEESILLAVSARDPESNIIDYAYSLDGGETFSRRFPWPEGDILTGDYPDSARIRLNIPAGSTASLVFQVYNPYDLIAQSNPLTVTMPLPTKEEEEAGRSEEFEDATALVLPSENTDTAEKEVLSWVLLAVKIALPIVGFLFLIFLFGYIKSRGKK